MDIVRLKQVREDAGLSQLEFAEKINIGVSSYNAYENGKQIPRVDVIETICELFNVSADWLLGLNDGVSNIRTYANVTDVVIELLDTVTCDLIKGSYEEFLTEIDLPVAPGYCKHLVAEEEYCLLLFRDKSTISMLAKLHELLKFRQEAWFDKLIKGFKEDYAKPIDKDGATIEDEKYEKIVQSVSYAVRDEPEPLFDF